MLSPSDVELTEYQGSFPMYKPPDIPTLPHVGWGGVGGTCDQPGHTLHLALHLTLHLTGWGVGVHVTHPTPGTYEVI